MRNNRYYLYVTILHQISFNSNLELHISGNLMAE